MASSALNTPTINPDMMRKDAMYWATRFWMTSQPASTTMMVVKLVSRISGTEMPSTPRW